MDIFTKLMFKNNLIKSCRTNSLEMVIHPELSSKALKFIIPFSDQESVYNQSLKTAELEYLKEIKVILFINKIDIIKIFKTVTEAHF